MHAGSRLAYWALSCFSGGKDPLAWVLSSGGTRATLDINFVSGQAKNGSSNVTIASLLTCTRATPALAYYTKADGTLTTFAPNTLRYGTNGLLVEEARTNSVSRSQTFASANWNQTNLAATDNATAAPDGTTTAASLIPDTTPISVHRVFNGELGSLTTTAASYSFYAKANGYNQVLIRENATTGSSVGFTLSGAGSATAGSGSGGGTWSNIAITALANDWYYCRATLSFGAGTGQRMSLAVADGGYTSGDANSYVWTPNGTSGVYLWGAQLEDGAFATSYIPTTTASVTRAADVVTVPSATINYSATEGTMYSQFGATNTRSGFQGLMAFDDTGTNNRIHLQNFTGGPFVRLSTVASGSDVGDARTTVISASGKVAGVYKSADYAISLNGGAAGTNSTAGSIPTITTLRIGSSAAGSEYWSDYIKRVAYWNTRLSNGALQTLTT